MAEEEKQIELKDEGADLAQFDPTKKKKKKKVVIQDPAEESVEQLVEKTDNLPDHIGEDEKGDGIHLQQQKNSWDGTDRDYTYEELLSVVFHNRHEHNPELAGERRKIILRPPQVVREGPKRTVLVNFMDLCKSMHRSPDHVMAFLLAELGASGSIDGKQRLVVKNSLASKNFEGILRQYFNEYVICNGCKSADTILQKASRLVFIKCETCGSERSVAPIKAGFVALVGSRKAGR